MRSAELKGCVDLRRRPSGSTAARSTPHSAFHIPHFVDSAILNPQSAILAVAVLARSQVPDPWPVLDHASQMYQTIRTLSAQFVQIIENPMIGAPDTTRGKLYQMRPSRFAMRFTEPKGDRIVADGRDLWVYSPRTARGQVIRSRIPEVGTTGPNLIGQFVERPRERYRARYVPPRAPLQCRVAPPPSARARPRPPSRPAGSRHGRNGPDSARAAARRTAR